jgi:hypothetical protein
VKEKGQGGPDQKPKYLFIRPPQEQEGAQKEKKANNSLISPVEQKLSNKLSPLNMGDEDKTPRCVYRPPFGRELIPENWSPVMYHELLRDKVITEEQAQEFEGYWRERFKKWSTQYLEEGIRDMRELWAFSMKFAVRETTPARRDYHKEQAQDATYQLGLLQQELQRRQKKSDSD